MYEIDRSKSSDKSNEFFFLKKMYNFLFIHWIDMEFDLVNISGC